MTFVLFLPKNNSFGLNFWTWAWCSSSRENGIPLIECVLKSMVIRSDFSFDFWWRPLLLSWEMVALLHGAIPIPVEFVPWTRKSIPRSSPKLGGLGHRKKTPCPKKCITHCCSSKSGFLTPRFEKILFLLIKPSKNQRQIFWILDGDHQPPQATFRQVFSSVHFSWWTGNSNEISRPCFLEGWSFSLEFDKVTPRKLTYPMKIDGWFKLVQMKFPFNKWSL